ncbi:retrovirus-related pol polyprotein from transposon TNT 1-94 [Tanacetum coccineum]
MYDSWASRIRLFIKGKKNGRMMLDSIDNGPLVYPTVEENGQTRPKKYSELTEVQQLQDKCDVQEQISFFTDSLAVMNDMHTIRLTMQQVQVNTKFLNALPREWSKFVTDVKLEKSLYTTNYAQLYAYLSQHERHANEVYEFPQLDSGLAVPTYQQGDDPIECINKSMAFLSAVASRGIATTSKGNYVVGQEKENLMLVEAQEASQILDEEQLSFIANPGIAEYDISSAKVVLMEKFSSCNPDVLSESCVNECNKCLELETGLLKKKDLIEKDVYDKLFKSYSTLEKHCISLELTTQLNQEVFQKDNFYENQNAPTFNQLFELNELKAHSQERDTVIKKLKDGIKSLSEKDNVDNVKKDINEIVTINIELEHSVAKLFSKNENLRKEREHLNSIYKDQFDSIRKTRVQSKEHCDSLIAQINAMSVENSDLNVQLQEKVFAIAALKNKLRKLKGKNVVDTAVSKPTAIITPGMFKLDIEPIFHRLKNNRDAHEELLVYVSKTCPSLTKSIEKLVVVTPMNKDKKVRFAKPDTSSSNILKQTNSLKTKDSNKPLLTSTGVTPTTSASGSKPSGNTKNNRITRTPSSNQKNNVEDHPRKVKSSLNKMNFIYEPNSNAHVKHSVRNAKFESICAICNKCLFDANHDMCIIDYVNDVVQIVLWYLDSGCSKHMTKNRSRLINFVSKFLGTVRFGNDHIAEIMAYGDYQMGNVIISRVYYVEGLVDDDLLKGSRGLNLYTLSMDNLLLSSTICLLSKASKTKYWLWHRRLSHLNIDYITSLAKQGLVRGLPKLKYPKDHLIQSINGTKYILVIVDDYSRFTWVKFLRSKDEVPEFVIKFLKMIQVLLNSTVRNIRTDNRTEFVNLTLKAYYEEVRISHQTSIARTPLQNGVVERWNHTLVEAVSTMLIFSKALLFLWT